MKAEERNGTGAPYYFLDITSEMCPMTFVKTKLMAEKMKAGERAEVRLNAGEPLENVPRSLKELGFRVGEPVPEEGAEGVYRIEFSRPE